MNMCLVCDADIKEGNEIKVDEHTFCCDVHADEYLSDVFEFGKNIN